MKEVKYNPFGSTEDQYSYNSIPVSSSHKKESNWKLISVLFVVACIIIAYVIIFATVEQSKKEADSSIDEFNSSLISVHDSFSDPQLPQDLRDKADEMEEKIGKEDMSVKSTRILSNVIGHFDSSAPAFDKNGEREKEAVKIAPYYAACDISSYSLEVDSIDYKGMCEEFTTVANSMMSDVRRYNDMSQGIMGKITLHTQPYVDVMNKPGEKPSEISSDKEDNKEDSSSVEGGKLPPQE